MRNPLLLTSAAAIACLALNACGGSNEPAKSPDDSERAAEKASDAADKASDAKERRAPAVLANSDRTDLAELRATSVLSYPPRS